MTEIGLGHYLTLAAIIFAIGVVGIFLNRKNVIIILMSIELILVAVNINLVSFSIYLQDLTGQVFAMFIFDCCGRRGCSWFSNNCRILQKQGINSC